MNYKKEIIAVLDPMCSWCWGFAPVLEKIKENLPADTKLSICMGGLRSSGEQNWTEEFRSYLKENWDNVNRYTAQNFNIKLLEKKDFDYNTEPSCRAVLCVKTMDESKVLSFMHHLQKAFYEEALDITQTDIILDIVKQEGLDEQIFSSLFESKKIIEATLGDKYKARSMGANSFPSLVFIDLEGHLYVLKGYKDYEDIKKHI